MNKSEGLAAVVPHNHHHLTLIDLDGSRKKICNAGMETRQMMIEDIINTAEDEPEAPHLQAAKGRTEDAMEGQFMSGTIEKTEEAGVHRHLHLVEEINRDQPHPLQIRINLPLLLVIEQRMLF